MAMAAARVGAQPPSVKCRICGRPSLRGAKLCEQCVAAVKRARDVNTIASQFLPQPRPGTRVNFPLRAPRSSLRRNSARWSWIPTKPAGWGILIAFTAFGAAVAGTAYLAVQEIAEGGLRGQMVPVALDPAAAHAKAPPPTIDASARVTAAPAAESAAIQPAARPDATVMAPDADVSPPVVQPPQATPLPERPVTRKPATENRKRSAARATTAASRDGEGDGKVTITAPESVDVARVPAAAPAPDPPVPDRWETMNAAIAACSRENFLAGMMCTERVRYQYCDGYWGQVPQCRAAARPGSSR